MSTLSDLTAAGIDQKDLSSLKLQRELAAAWMTLHPGFAPDNVHVVPSIEHAISTIRGVASKEETTEFHILVTGSLHLVGGVIEAAGLGKDAL